MNQFKTPEKSIEINNNESSTKIMKEITNILYKHISVILPSNISQEKKEKIDIYFNKIFILIKKLSTERKQMISKYDSLLRLSEEKIRALYSILFNMKIKITFLENNIDMLLRKEKEYRLVKEKTGILVENGVVIHNDRKENEIFILRTENSNLKNVIKKKEEDLKNLNDKYKKEKIILIKKIEEIKQKFAQIKNKNKSKNNNKSKGHSCSCLNLNNIDINDAYIINPNRNKKNNIYPIKHKYNSNLSNNDKYISLIHCQSMGHLNPNFLKQNKSHNKVNNNINISKPNNPNMILSNINVSPIKSKKQLYFTPHNNEINSLYIKNSKSKQNSKAKIKKDKMNIKVIYKSKTKTNKNTEINKELTLSKNISLNNSGIPKSMKKKSNKKINNKRSKSKQYYNDNDINNKKGLSIINISGKENIPINKNCLSSIIRKNTINTSNNSFYSKIF